MFATANGVELKTSAPMRASRYHRNGLLLTSDQISWRALMLSTAEMMIGLAQIRPSLLRRCTRHGIRVQAHIFGKQGQVIA